MIVKSYALTLPFNFPLFYSFYKCNTNQEEGYDQRSVSKCGSSPELNRFELAIFTSKHLGHICLIIVFLIWGECPSFVRISGGIETVFIPNTIAGTENTWWPRLPVHSLPLACMNTNDYHYALERYLQKCTYWHTREKLEKSTEQEMVHRLTL